MRSLICLIVVAALHSPHAIAESTVPTKPVVQVGYYEFAPYSYTDADHRPQGSILKLTERLLERAGYQAEYRTYPSARLYQGLIDGSIHIWPGAPGKTELSGYTLESRRSLGTIALNLYYRADTPAPSLPAALHNQRVILINGYTYWAPANQWLDDPQLKIQQVRTNNHASALAMLMHRRADYLLDYQAPIELESKLQQVEALPYAELRRIHSTLVISKKAPHAEKLRQDLDHAFDVLKAEGVKMSLY